MPVTARCSVGGHLAVVLIFATVWAVLEYHPVLLKWWGENAALNSAILVAALVVPAAEAVTAAAAVMERAARSFGFRASTGRRNSSVSCLSSTSATISAVIFLVSATVHLAAIEIIMLDNDGWTASANAMCTCIIVIVLVMLGILQIVAKKTGRRPEGLVSEV